MSVEPELREAIEKLKAGNQEALHIFYMYTYQFVYARAKFTVRDEHEAQDLMQEVYLAAYKNIGSLKNTDSVYSWLSGITLRQGMKLVNRKKRNILLSEDQEGMFEGLPDESRGAEERIAREEEIQIMKDCIYELSEEQRAVILAYYYDEMKVEEIARLLEISEGTVKSRLYHARKRMKASLEELEKKQGYRMYSISIPAVLAAVGYLLGENTITAEAAGGVYSRNLFLCRDDKYGGRSRKTAAEEHLARITVLPEILRREALPEHIQQAEPSQILLEIHRELQWAIQLEIWPEIQSEQRSEIQPEKQSGQQQAKPPG